MKGLPFLAKMVYKRVKLWTLGWSFPVQNILQYIFCQCVVPDNIHTSRTEGISASYSPFKILAFETHLPLRISNDLPWGGYGYFLELCNGNNMTVLTDYWAQLLLSYSWVNVNFDLSILQIRKDSSKRLCPLVLP